MLSSSHTEPAYPAVPIDRSGTPVRRVSEPAYLGVRNRRPRTPERFRDAENVEDYRSAEGGPKQSGSSSSNRPGAIPSA